MNQHALIIGYGNPLRGDDGLGWEVAGRLAACVPDRSVSIMTVQQLTPELSEPIHDADLVIFIDASSEGNPGAWKCDSVEPAFTNVPALGHHGDVAGLLAYTKGVFLSCPKALIVSVTAETFDCHDALSRQVESVLPAVVRHIREQLDSLNLNSKPSHA